VPVPFSRIAATLAAVTVLAGGVAGASSGSLATRSAAGQEAWVATGAFDSQPGDVVTPVDLAARRVDPAVTTGSQPVAMAVAGAHALVVVNRGVDTLSVVDTTTGTVTGTVVVGMQPDAVAYVPGVAGGHPMALVANFGSDTVTPVDLTTLHAGKPIPVGKQPDAIGVWTPGDAGNASSAGNGSGGRGVAVVANFGDGTVTPIDLATMQPGPAVSAGTEPDAVGIVPPIGDATTGSATALVADFGTDTVIPVDVATMTDGLAVGLGGNPTDMAVAADGTAWVAGGAALTPLAPTPSSPPTSSAPTGSTAGPVSFAAGTPLSLPGEAEAVVLQGSGTAWVALQNGDLVSVALPSGKVGRPVHVGGRPSAVVIPSWS